LLVWYLFSNKNFSQAGKKLQKNEEKKPLCWAFRISQFLPPNWGDLYLLN